MSRAFAAVGVGMATLVGIATAYTTFQPELQRQQAERLGLFTDQHAEKPNVNDNVISQAIISDFREAKEQAAGTTSKTGPAWKLRQMLFGKKTEGPAVEERVTVPPAVQGAGGDDERSR